MVYGALANILKARALEAAQHQEDADGRQSVIRGFGDLVVLVNPAFEALLYAPLNELAAGFRRFSPVQTPVLLTIASETDRPNRVWFPLGRRVDSLFQSTGDRSPRRAVVTAVGNYEEFWTHRLTAARPLQAGAEAGTRGAGLHGCACDLPLESIDENEARYLLSLLLGHGTQAPSEGGAAAPYGRALLTPLKPIDPRNPFWVIRASDEVVHGHNGIFTSYLIDFIRRVIIEASARSRTGP